MAIVAMPVALECQSNATESAHAKVALLVSPPRNVLLTHAKWRAALTSLERHACQTSVADAMQDSSLENSRSLSSVLGSGVDEVCCGE